MKILIAEDDTITRRILQRAVEQLGHESIPTRDGEEAWEVFQAEPEIDAIISDRMMPGMDGIELCRRVRQSSAESYTFFIFITAMGEKGDLIEGLTAGADDYLIKPLDQEQLQARLIAASRVTGLHRRLKELNRELFETSRRDALTHLGNRLKLREDLEQLSASIERYDYRCCAMLCDIDYFKNYNDTYGHLAGDDVLRVIADTISSTLRVGDSAYRYGGEEFLITLPEQTLESAATVAERLRERVEELAIPHSARTSPEIVTVSIGLAEVAPGNVKSAENLLREADEALYRAKEKGRNLVIVNGNGAGLR